MHLKVAVLLSAHLLLSSGANSQRKAAVATANQQPTATTTQAGVQTETLNLFDPVRNRAVPVVLYLPDLGGKIEVGKIPKRKLAILNHGYGGTNTAYTFIAQNLVAHGYCVASIQHELPGDALMPTTGNVREVRRPHWTRGVQNMRFVLQELKKTNRKLDYKRLLLIGHSNGGDMAMLFAQEYPALVQHIISLDNRRMPLPRTRRPRILSIRSRDQVADEGVLPTAAEQQKLEMQIVSVNTLHNDMWDGATDLQKQEINRIISKFLGIK